MILVSRFSMWGWFLVRTDIWPQVYKTGESSWFTYSCGVTIIYIFYLNVRQFNENFIVERFRLLIQVFLFLEARQSNLLEEVGWGRDFGSKEGVDVDLVSFALGFGLCGKGNGAIDYYEFWSIQIIYVKSSPRGLLSPFSCLLLGEFFF